MPPELKIAIVADDLTGAMDTAAPFAARGALTRVFLTLPAQRFTDAAEVVSFTTDSRHSPAQAAYEKVSEAVSNLLGGEPRLVFKKIDSTVRGNVALETLAALKASGRRHAIVTPAFPAQGRTLVDGEIFVHGTRLIETAIGRDGLSPPPTAPLPEVFRAHTADWQIHALARGQDLELSCAPGSHVYIADAATEDDLRRIAAQALVKDEAVLVGSGGLGRALAEVVFEPRARPAWPQAKGPLLCIVGSRTPQSVQQTQRLIERGAACVEVRAVAGELVSPPWPVCLAEVNAKTPALVVRIARTDGVAVAAEAVAAALAALAHRLLDTGRFAGVIVTGGDTARALLQRLGVSALDLVGELLPGIALTTIEFGGNRLPLVTKAGGFGDADLFASIVDKLCAPAPT